MQTYQQFTQFIYIKIYIKTESMNAYELLKPYQVFIIKKLNFNTII